MTLCDRAGRDLVDAYIRMGKKIRRTVLLALVSATGLNCLVLVFIGS